MTNKFKMKKILSLTLVLILLASLSSIVLARSGVGIVWSSQSQILSPGEQTCLSYGVYNPWDESVDAKITVTDTLKEVIQNEKSEAKTIPANTFHDAAIPVELCFEVPKIYKEDCLAPGIACKQTCQEEEKNYEGEILVVQNQGSTDSGSSTAVGVTAPLNIKVKCTPYDRDYRTPLVLFMVVLLGVFVARKYWKHK